MEHTINHCPHLDSNARTRANCTYTIRMLHEAFSMVANPENWKTAIRARVDAHFRPILEDAIPFMTGSVASFEDVGGGKVIVRAAGYYAEIGA